MAKKYYDQEQQKANLLQTKSISERIKRPTKKDKKADKSATQYIKAPNTNLYENYLKMAIPTNLWNMEYTPSPRPMALINNFQPGDKVMPSDNAKSTAIPKGTQGEVLSTYMNDVTVKFPNKTVQWTSNSLQPWVKPVHKVSFDSVIMPDHKKQMILEAIEQTKHHNTIFNEWGFDEVFEKGTAISMLFYGVPGTGKTLMAQAIADKLGKKLKVLGTADIESSEPGAAERAILDAFTSAGEDTVLLFDECDSLIYDRADVGVILAAQVNALLSALENYTGIVVFTTNRLGVLDEAFNRRLSLKLEFEIPDELQRIKIWQRMFPKKAPVSNSIDWHRLAKVEVTGGYIKNTVLRAVRMTASRGLNEITTETLVDALREEVKSMAEFEQQRANTSRNYSGGIRRVITNG